MSSTSWKCRDKEFFHPGSLFQLEVKISENKYSEQLAQHGHWPTSAATGAVTTWPCAVSGDNALIAGSWGHLSILEKRLGEQIGSP